MNSHISEILCAQKPGALILDALEELLQKDRLLLELDANERSICYRLAMYIQARLPEFHVDCEYNRDGIDPKKIQHLDLTPDEEDTEAKTAFPDIIAHIRNTRRNYFVIEIKKSTNTTKRDTDYAKLRGYKKNLGFDFALFLELNTNDNIGVSVAEWI
jgi:hypothetical protein